MSKKHNREERINERLQEEVKKLKQENRQLRQRLKNVSKGYYKYLLETEDIVEENIIETNKNEVKKICWDCGIGEYKEIIVMKRRWRQCQSCGKKGKVSILK